MNADNKENTHFMSTYKFDTTLTYVTIRAYFFLTYGCITAEYYDFRCRTEDDNLTDNQTLC